MIDNTELYNFLYPRAEKIIKRSNLKVDRYRIHEFVENTILMLNKETESMLAYFEEEDYQEDKEKYYKEQYCDDEDDDEDDEDEDEYEEEDEEYEGEDYSTEGKVVKVGIKKSYDYLHIIMEETYEMLNMKYNKEIIEYQVDAAMNNEDLYANIRNLFIYYISEQYEDSSIGDYRSDVLRSIRNEG